MKTIAMLLVLLTTGCAVIQDRKAAVAYAYADTAATLAAVKEEGTFFGTFYGVSSV